MPQDDAPRRLRFIGPRGIEGLFGWTFFDPANLVAFPLLAASAVLVVIAMRGRGAADAFMAVGLYLCLAAFLRGYFFKYYHGRPVGRVAVLLILLLGLGASGVLWLDRAPEHLVLRARGPVTVPAAPGFRLAAIFHLVVGLTLLIHFLLPRRWLVRATDQLADRAGRDTAPDAPTETIDDPVERERRAAEDGVSEDRG